MKKSIDNKCIDKLTARLICLILSAGIGGVLFRYSRELFYCVLGVDIYSGDDKLIPIPAIDGILLGVLVLVTLWYFRTRDVRQQIAKQDAQIQQGNFVSGLNKIVADKALTVSIGVKILMSVSDKTDEFNDDIRLAFIKRLKQYISDKSGNPPKKMRLTYVQWILYWLHKHPEEKMDLDDCNFINQDFVIPDMTFGKLDSLAGSEVWNWNFENVRICRKWLEDLDENSAIAVTLEARKLAPGANIFECQCAHKNEKLVCKKDFSHVPALT